MSTSGTNCSGSMGKCTNRTFVVTAIVARPQQRDHAWDMASTFTTKLTRLLRFKITFSSFSTLTTMFLVTSFFPLLSVLFDCIRWILPGWKPSPCSSFLMSSGVIVSFIPYYFLFLASFLLLVGRCGIGLNLLSKISLWLCSRPLWVGAFWSRLLWLWLVRSRFCLCYDTVSEYYWWYSIGWVVLDWLSWLLLFGCCCWWLVVTGVVVAVVVAVTVVAVGVGSAGVVIFGVDGGVVVASATFLAFFSFFLPFAWGNLGEVVVVVVFHFLGFRCRVCCWCWNRWFFCFSRDLFCPMVQLQQLPSKPGLLFETKISPPARARLRLA